MIGLTGNWAFAAEQLPSRPASAAINGKKTINAPVRSIALAEKKPKDPISLRPLMAAKWQNENLVPVSCCWRSGSFL